MELSVSVVLGVQITPSKGISSMSWKPILVIPCSDKFFLLELAQFMMKGWPVGKLVNRETN